MTITFTNNMPTSEDVSLQIKAVPAAALAAATEVPVAAKKQPKDGWKRRWHLDTGDPNAAYAVELMSRFDAQQNKTFVTLAGITLMKISESLTDTVWYEASDVTLGWSHQGRYPKDSGAVVWNVQMLYSIFTQDLDGTGGFALNTVVDAMTSGLVNTIIG